MPYNPTTAPLEMSPAETIAFWALENEAADRAVEAEKPGTPAHFRAWNQRAWAYNHLLVAQDEAATPDARRFQEWHNSQS